MARLGDICRFQSGGTPSKSNLNFYGGNIPWITTIALNGGIIDNNNAVEWITDRAIQESAAKIVPQNSIMVGTRVGIGKVAINSVPMSTSQDVVSLLDIDTANWDKGYLCKFILAKSSFLLSQARGATIKGIKIDTLSDLQVPDVSLEEQQRIAALLDKVSDLIAKRREQLDKLDLLVKAKFVEMFCDSSDCVKWPTVTIADISTDMRTGPFGSALHHDEFVEKGVFVLGIDNAVENRFSYNRMRYITEEKYQQLKRYTVKPGDVIITIMGTVGRSAVIPDDIPKAINTKHLACLTIDSAQAVPDFICCAFQMHPQIREQLAGQTKGAIMDGLNLTIIKKLNFRNPPLSLQNQFVHFFKEINKMKSAINSSLHKLEILKKALMQQYFG